MKDKLSDILLNILGFSICVLIALLVFNYVVVPMANNYLYDKVIYVPVPEEEMNKTKKLKVNLTGALLN